MRVLSLYESSWSVSSSAMASSNAYSTNTGSYTIKLNSIENYFFCELTSLRRVVLNLIKEDRIVKSKTKANRMC